MNLKMAGALVILAGIVILIIGSILPLFDVPDRSVLIMVKVGIFIAALGIIFVIIVLIKERIGEVKEFKEEIDEKELRP